IRGGRFRASRAVDSAVPPRPQRHPLQNPRQSLLKSLRPVVVVRRNVREKRVISQVSSSHFHFILNPKSNLLVLLKFLPTTRSAAAGHSHHRGGPGDTDGHR